MSKNTENLFKYDKKLNDKYNRQNKINKLVKESNQLNNVYLSNEQEGYLLPENENEKTLKISQNYLKKNIAQYNKDNMFNLNLENYGPFHLDFTRNGKFLLLGGEKGNLTILNWRTKELLLNFDTENKIKAVKFLQNEKMFASAEEDMVYIYDSQGIELHALNFLNSPIFLEYLPYHYLLVSALKNNSLKYLDISIGKEVSEIKTKSGVISSICQNPYNGVIITGHSTGLINMFTPNYGSTPVVKIFGHSSKINSISCDIEGKYLASISNDSKLKIFDIRNTYQTLYEYYTPSIGSSLTISQKGLLAYSYNNIVEIWKDVFKQKQKEPYMKHHFQENKTKVVEMKFVNFEDFLGASTNIGFSSLLVPGSGIANFDSFENNVFETKNQRREKEVKNLLEKIPYNMITLDPFRLNTIDPRSKKVIEKEKEEEIKNKVEERFEKIGKKIKKNKQRGKKDVDVKQLNKEKQIKMKMKAAIEREYNKKINEKKIIKEDVKALNDLGEDFDPGLFVNDKEEDDKDEDENEESVEN